MPNTGLGKTGALVFEAHIGTAWWVSDGTWKARKCHAWDEEPGVSSEPISGGVPVEILVASKLPVGWQPHQEGHFPHN